MCAKGTTVESERFDRLTRKLTEKGSRRGLLQLGAGLPLAGLLAALGFAPESSLARDKQKRRRRRRRQELLQDAICGEYRQPCCKDPFGDGVCKGTTLICAPWSNTCVFCGYHTEPCCVGDNCVDGATCVAGKCLPCGLKGYRCCGGGTCGGQARCQDGVCR